MRQRVFVVTAGGRGGTTDSVFFSGFNVERIVATAYKLDAGTVGQLYAVNNLLQYFDPYARAAHDDVPKLYYGWFPPDGGTVAHESVSGAAMTVALGAGTGIVIGGNQPGAGRFASSWGRLNNQSSATLFGNAWIVASEAAALSWTWMGWCLYLGGSTANIYFETNAAQTTFHVLQLLATGAVQIGKGGIGGGGYASAAGILPLSQWVHLGIVYNVGAGTITVFVNAVAVAGPTAYARATTSSGPDRVIINGLANGVVATAGIEVYSNVVMNADDMQRHMDYVNVDLIGGGFVAGTANLGRHSTGTVIFSNDLVPGFDSASYTVRMPVTAINVITTVAGIFLLSVETWERETY